MKLHRLAALAAIALTLAAPATSFAQVAGSAKFPTSEGALKVVALGYRASQLLKSPVYNLDGNKMGSVVDIIITKDSDVSVFIIDVGGFLGLGQKQIAVPASAFKFVDKKVVLPGVTVDQLKSLPTFHFSTL